MDRVGVGADLFAVVQYPPAVRLTALRAGNGALAGDAGSEDERTVAVGVRNELMIVQSNSKQR